MAGFMLDSLTPVSQLRHWAQGKEKAHLNIGSRSPSQLSIGLLISY